MDRCITLLVAMGFLLNLTPVTPFKVERVTHCDDKGLLGESGVWHPCLQAQIWVDIPGRTVNRLYPELSKVLKIKTENPLSFAVPRCNGKGMVIGQADRVDFLGNDDRKQVPFVTKERLGLEEGFATNDGKADPLGRLWFGTLPPLDRPFTELPVRAGLYSVTPDGVLKQHLNNLTISNGMDWTQDGKTFLLADSVRSVVWAFDFDMDKGEISNQRQAYRFPEGPLGGVPDGLTIDANGNAWVAIYNGSMVVNFDPKTGREIQRIDLYPVSYTTCPNFGGANLDELYVTSGYGPLTPKQRVEQPDAGVLFKITGLGVKGRVPNFFAG